MIACISGEVIFCDGQEVIINTASGVGYQIVYWKVVAEGSWISLFISHIIREDSQTLFGFSSLREKKMFEVLMTVKGVGPKSAFSLVNAIGVDELCQAIAFDNKKTLTQAPGIGQKAAAQIMLDLSGKIQKIKMYSENYKSANSRPPMPNVSSTDLRSLEENIQNESHPVSVNANQIIQDTISACKQLGFRENEIIGLAQRIMNENEIVRAEQLVHLVLKEI